MAEWYAHTYHVNPAELGQVPMATLLGVYVAAQIRGGDYWGEPSYEERDEDERGT